MLPYSSFTVEELRNRQVVPIEDHFFGQYMPQLGFHIAELGIAGEILQFGRIRIEVVKFVHRTRRFEIGIIEPLGKLSVLMSVLDLRPSRSAGRVNGRIGDPWGAVVDEFVAIAPHGSRQIVSTIGHRNGNGSAPMGTSLDENVGARRVGFSSQ